MVVPAKGIVYEFMNKAHHQGVLRTGQKLACSDFELNAVECVEAYGLQRGYHKCRDFLIDYDECLKNTVTRIRNEIMDEERVKQILKGNMSATKAKSDENFKYDSYIDGQFSP